MFNLSQFYSGEEEGGREWGERRRESGERETEREIGYNFSLIHYWVYTPGPGRDESLPFTQHFHVPLQQWKCLATQCDSSI